MCILDTCRLSSNSRWMVHATVIITDLPSLTSCAARIGEDFRFTFSRDGDFLGGISVLEFNVLWFSDSRTQPPMVEPKEALYQEQFQVIRQSWPKYDQY